MYDRFVTQLKLHHELGSCEALLRNPVLTTCRRTFATHRWFPPVTKCKPLNLNFILESVRWRYGTRHGLESFRQTFSLRCLRALQAWGVVHNPCQWSNEKHPVWCLLSGSQMPCLYHNWWSSAWRSGQFDTEVNVFSLHEFKGHAKAVTNEDVQVVSTRLLQTVPTSAAVPAETQDFTRKRSWRGRADTFESIVFFASYV